MKIDYKVKYSNRKTLNISVERNRNIIVRAPNNLSAEAIEKIVQSKREWIKEKLNSSQKYPILDDKKEFVSGETLMYLGKNYQLTVVDEEFSGIKFEDRFKISRSNQHIANELFKKWYLTTALIKIEPIALEYSKNIGVTFNRLKATEMKYRWGSCTPSNNIIFNWRIIKAPLYVLHYIIVHELAHLKERNHSASFWNIVSIQLPKYEKAKEWLKLNGHLLEIDF